MVIFVKLYLSAKTIISAHNAENKTDELSEAFKERDKLQGFVVEYDESGKSTELSQLEEDVTKAKPRKEAPERSETVETGTPTLGEVSGLAEKLAEKEKEEKSK